MDLSTSYLGLRLESPLVPSACQALTNEISNIRKMEDCGAGAVVLYSLFEEQLTQDARELDYHTTEYSDSFSEAASFMPEPGNYLLGPEEYLNHIASAKKAVDIPIIASLNAATPGTWADFAQKIEAAGADALELNIYNVAADAALSGGEIEKNYLEIVKTVREKVKIPLAVKLSPYFTSLSHMVKQLDQAGADGVVLFNRFYQPDINLDELEIRPDIILSNPLTLRLPLRWTAILYGRIKADIAATSGVHKADDVLKLLMAGAKATMLCSSLLRYGIEHMRTIIKDMSDWLEENEYQDIQTMQGSMSQIRCENPAGYERAQYINSLHQFKPRWEKA